VGDKNPKSQARAKKQGEASKEKAKVAHDKKHAPAPPAVKKGK
jgi:hypothetical protein